MAPCHQGRISHTEAFRQQLHTYSEHASSLTLRQQCQRATALEEEHLERCAAADGCQGVIESVQSQNQYSSRPKPEAFGHQRYYSEDRRCS